MAGCKWCTWVVDKDDQDWYYDKLWALGSRLKMVKSPQSIVKNTRKKEKAELFISHSTGVDGGPGEGEHPKLCRVCSRLYRLRALEVTFQDYYLSLYTLWVCAYVCACMCVYAKRGK